MIGREKSDVEKMIERFLGDMQGVTIEEMEKLRRTLAKEGRALHYAENLLLELINIKKEEQANDENTNKDQSQNEQN